MHNVDFFTKFTGNWYLSQAKRLGTILLFDPVCAGSPAIILFYKVTSSSIRDVPADLVVDIQLYVGIEIKYVILDSYLKYVILGN